ncbi:MAG: redoxin domain-containing protein [Gammaproteobacteria bacterium]|jgi:hypothetical protein|nr:redoxin domain-containing protein [Gammaproteobacteria bacterium]MDX2459237.1 redoxin domain-containing protein [Gammaproteobacteria bacterium]
MMTISRPVWGLLAVIFLGISACDGDALSGVKDLDGRYADPTSDSAARATVTLFVDSDCPVSNRYAPEVQRLYRQYAAQGVKFWLVYPDPRISVATIREHMREYGYEIPALRDPEHALVRRANALVTPEAGIFLADGTLVYHGRIDNRYVDLTRRRPDATQHDVADVLDAVLAGKAVDASWSPAPGRSLKAMSQPGVGCYIGDFK